MWYFTWVLGVAAALALGIINVMWYEAQEAFVADDTKDIINDAPKPSSSDT